MALSVALFGCSRLASRRTYYSNNRLASLYLSQYGLIKILANLEVCLNAGHQFRGRGLVKIALKFLVIDVVLLDLTVIELRKVRSFVV